MDATIDTRRIRSLRALLIVRIDVVVDCSDPHRFWMLDVVVECSNRHCC